MAKKKLTTEQLNALAIEKFNALEDLSKELFPLIKGNFKPEVLLSEAWCLENIYETNDEIKEKFSEEDFKQGLKGCVKLGLIERQDETYASPGSHRAAYTRDKVELTAKLQVANMQQIVKKREIEDLLKSSDTRKIKLFSKSPKIPEEVKKKIADIQKETEVFYKQSREYAEDLKKARKTVTHSVNALDTLLFDDAATGEAIFAVLKDKKTPMTAAQVAEASESISEKDAERVLPELARILHAIEIDVEGTKYYTNL